MATTAEYVEERSQIYCACLHLGKSGDSLAVRLKSDDFNHGFRAAVNKWERLMRDRCWRREPTWRTTDEEGRKTLLNIYCACLLNLGRSGDVLAEYLKSDDFDHGFNSAVCHFAIEIDRMLDD